MDVFDDIETSSTRAFFFAGSTVSDEWSCPSPSSSSSSSSSSLWLYELQIEARPFRPDEAPDVLMMSFNGDEVDCTLEREVAAEMVKLLFFVVVVDVEEEISGDEVDLLTEFEAKIDFFCKTDA